MKSPSPESTKLVLVAVFSIMVGSLTPSFAASTRRAVAPNADRVDGLHAVGAGASIEQRKGRLVATSKAGRLPDNIIRKAPNADKLAGNSLKYVRTQWLTVRSDGSIQGSSPGASSLTVTRPAVGTYCVSRGETIADSMAGNVQSQVNAFEDLTMIVSSTVNTSACPGEIRIYTATAGVLADNPFTLTFAIAKPSGRSAR